MAYSREYIREITNKAAELMEKDHYGHNYAIWRALDLNGLKYANDRRKVFSLVSKQLGYRAKSAKEKKAKDRAIAEKNLSFPFVA